MSKTVPLPYYADDVSALARALSAQLQRQLPAVNLSHVEMLNVLSRAIGHRNYQHLRASALAHQRLHAAPPRDALDVDYTALERIADYFDQEGRLTRWPKKFSHQLPCMWIIWSHIPARRKFAEREINAFIKSAHTFADHALLRRELVNYGLVRRQLDCTDYERVEQAPPKEVVVLMRLIARRAAGVERTTNS